MGGLGLLLQVAGVRHERGTGDVLAAEPGKDGLLHEGVRDVLADADVSGVLAAEDDAVAVGARIRGQEGVVAAHPAQGDERQQVCDFRPPLRAPAGVGQLGCDSVEHGPALGRFQTLQRRPRAFAVFAEV